MNEIEQALQGMNEEQLQALLAKEFDPELVKQAEASLAGNDLVESIYAYGAYCADREFAEADDEEPLSKEASAEFDGAEEEILKAMDEAQAASGVVENSDPVELQKIAQVCGAAMLEGYINQIEKLAEDAVKTADAKKIKKAKGFLDKTKARLGKAYEAAKGHGHEAMKYGKKHKGKAALIAGAGVGALGAHMALRHKSGHDKKASECTVAELADEVRMQESVENLIGDGIEKIAARGTKAGAAMGHMAKLKKHLGGAYDKARGHVGKHKAYYGAGTGAAAGAGGAALAHRLMGHKED